MTDEQAMVEEFHKKFDILVHTSPTDASEDTRRLRIRLIQEEFDELKEEIVRLGGTKKIRELLAAEEDTNRQAFIQNRRLVITTASRVLSDPLFSRVRFDVLIADEAPWIAAAPLLGAAGLVRERIVISGDQRDIAAAGLWASREAQLR